MLHQRQDCLVCCDWKGVVDESTPEAVNMYTEFKVLGMVRAFVGTDSGCLRPGQTTMVSVWGTPRNRHWI